MKKFFMLLSLAMCLMCATVVPAFATSEEDYLGDVEFVDDIEFPQSVHLPMPYDELTLLHTHTYSDLKNNSDGICPHKTYAASDFPSKTIFCTTNLASTGPNDTIKFGLAEYSSAIDRFVVDKGTLSPTKLKNSTYGHPPIKSNGRYRLAIYNLTGGVVRGTVTWYNVDRLS